MPGRRGSRTTAPASLFISDAVRARRSLTPAASRRPGRVLPATLTSRSKRTPVRRPTRMPPGRPESRAARSEVWSEVTPRVGPLWLDRTDRVGSPSPVLKRLAAGQILRAKARWVLKVVKHHRVSQQDRLLQRSPIEHDDDRSNREQTGRRYETQCDSGEHHNSRSGPPRHCPSHGALARSYASLIQRIDCGAGGAGRGVGDADAAGDGDGNGLGRGVGAGGGGAGGFRL